MTKVTEAQLLKMNIRQSAEDFQADLAQTSPEWLWSAFIFHQTPQGHSYWADRATGGLPLTEADREWLGEAVEALKRREAARPARPRFTQLIFNQSRERNLAMTYSTLLLARIYARPAKPVSLPQVSIQGGAK